MVRASLETLPTSGIEIYEAEFSPFFPPMSKKNESWNKKKYAKMQYKNVPIVAANCFCPRVCTRVSFCMEEEQSRLDFWEEGTKCRTQDNDDFSHSLAYNDEKELRSLLFYCFLLFQVNSQRTGEK